ncbi:MAG TPA: TRAP transporter substrate-binding protein, partial [Sphaerochaeta sp.]|nr:TRAP transporter substrate-binding protein [Sphaerochaeta sp.]
MKKILLSVLLVALLLTPAFAQGEKEGAAAAPKTVVLRLADNQPLGYPTIVGDEEFARLVGVYSDGRIKVEVYPQGQLADEK